MEFKAFKMDGLGNDFVIIDNRSNNVELNKDQIIKICDRNFIGCDIFADGVLRAIRNSVDDNLKNLQVFHLNIQDLLPFIPNNYLQEIRIYFPDPWPKNKHKKRRTVNQLLVKDLTKKLKKKGVIRFATDHGDYFIEALALMKKFKLNG